jgi:hypothetical protein
VFPLILLLPPLQDIFTPRYTNWYMAGLALAVGGGLAILPRVAAWGTVVGLLVIGTLPYDLYAYDSYGPDAGTTFRDLSAAMHAGDVILVDPLLTEARPIANDKWDYYRTLFFPAGMPLLDDEIYVSMADENISPLAWAGVRRIWYLRSLNGETPGLRNQLRSTHVRREFFGPPEFFVELWEGPPDPEGVRFDNGMRFHGIDLLEADGYNTHFQPTYREHDTVRFRSWWSVDEPLELDYSVTFFMITEEGGVETTVDMTSLVQLSPGEDPPDFATSRWEPGVYYTGEHQLPTTSASEGIKVAVYQWWDGVRIEGEQTDENGLLELLSFSIRAW